MVTSTVISNNPRILSLEDWMQNPPDNTEWVDGELMEKTGMTLKHSEVQSSLSFYWRSYKDSSRQGGKVYTEVPCRTNKQGRSPDVAYLTPELVAQYGDAKVLPQSFPLSAEIISHTDFAEDAIANLKTIYSLVVKKSGWYFLRIVGLLWLLKNLDKYLFLVKWLALKRFYQVSV